jgi:hypothetical protein
MKPNKMEKLAALNKKAGKQDELKNDYVSFQERVFLRVGRHVVHSLSSSEPD